MAKTKNPPLKEDSKQKLEVTVPEKAVERKREIKKEETKKGEESRTEQPLKGQKEVEQNPREERSATVLTRDDLEGLSDEGKEILKTVKDLKQKSTEVEVKTPIQKDIHSRTHRSELEDQLAQERIGNLQTSTNPEYGIQLAKQPMDTIYHEMTSLYHLAEEKGYLNPEEQRRVQYLTSAVEQKVQDAEEHRYEMTEEAAAVAGITRQIGSKLRNLYKGNSDYHSQYRSS